LIDCLAELSKEAAQHGTNGSAAPEVYDAAIPAFRPTYEPANDVTSYASFAPPNSGAQDLEMSPR